MGTLRNVALIVLAISFATFVALFGRLPALKKTPIGFLYKIIWVYLPSGIAYVDSSLLGGRLLRFWRRSGRYLLRENHPLVLIFFIALLSGSEFLLLYGVYLGYTLLDGTLQEIMPPITGSTGHWSKNVSWSAFFNIWGSVILEDIRIGAIFLLALMTAPLAVGFFLYHLYLIWAGMTTNENAKWGYWRDDIEDGFVFKAKRSEIYGEPGPENESPAPRTSWPAHTDQLLAITDGESPRAGYMLSSRSNSVIQPDDQNAPVDPRWVRISSLAEVENIYDLGFWGNLQDVLKLL
ncbi:hypothetical protein DTO021C3_1869 [Paecilomyces variotii]|nr:hypothetical protein DTO021C3_1869 [Paecilomyces variotii]